MQGLNSAFPFAKKTRSAEACVVAVSQSSGWWDASYPSNMLAYLRDGSAPTILYAATLRRKLKIQIAISPSHSRQILGQPVPARTL